MKWQIWGMLGSRDSWISTKDKLLYYPIQMKLVSLTICMQHFYNCTNPWICHGRILFLCHQGNTWLNISWKKSLLLSSREILEYFLLEIFSFVITREGKFSHNFCTPLNSAQQINAPFFLLFHISSTYYERKKLHFLKDIIERRWIMWVRFFICCIYFWIFVFFFCCWEYGVYWDNAKCVKSKASREK